MRYNAARIHESSLYRLLVNVSFDLPDALVQRLQTAGLLNDESVTRLLASALDAHGPADALNRAYMTLFEQTHDAVFIIAPDGYNIAVNRRAVELTGYSAQELLSMSFRQLSNEVTESNRTLVNLLGGGKVAPYERSFRTKSGALFRAEVTAELVRDVEGNPQYIQSVVRDITERKRAEQVLRDNERLLRQIIDLVPHHIFAKDRSGRYILANESVAQAYGTTIENLLGKTDADFVVSMDEADTFLVQDREVIESGQILTIPETSLTDAQGRKRTIRTIKMPLIFPNSTEPAVLGVSTDITEMKQAAAELRQAYRQAYDLAAQRQHVQLLTQFIQDTSHEFRTPLSVIATSLYLMTRTTDETKRDLHARNAANQIERITKLLDHLQTMADLDSEIPFDFVGVNVNFVLHEVVSHLVRSAEKISLAVHLDLADGLPAVFGDVMRLAQAFEHVLDNAVRFTPADGAVTVTTSGGAGTVTVEIRDTGIGIPADQIENVTRRFWRLDEAHSTPGFGLGIPIVQKIIERHKGTLTIESPNQAGTIVTITLPAI